MAEIILGKGEICLVDDDDYETLKNYRWNKSQYGYAYRLGDRKNGEKWKILMHRPIMKAIDGTIIDHINGDRLDNRKSNLRFVTTGQNNLNCVSRVGTSRFKGVSLSKNSKSKPWRAAIRFNHILYNLGEYATEQEAAIMYNEAAIRLHGEYARLNVL